jgi:hypothetical protein
MHLPEFQKGGADMAEEQFACAACGEEYEGDIRVTGVQECRICFRTHCPECIDENGICVPCSETEKKE